MVGHSHGDVVVRDVRILGVMARRCLHLVLEYEPILACNKKGSPNYICFGQRSESRLTGGLFKVAVADLFPLEKLLQGASNEAQRAAAEQPECYNESQTLHRDTRNTGQKVCSEALSRVLCGETSTRRHEN